MPLLAESNAAVKQADQADPDPRYLALVARDARYDGVWFVGVTSTRIYCRPICRVRTPKSWNCRWFGNAAQAEAASFRPCLKCRPELAPGHGLRWSTMDASRTLAHQAADALDAATHTGAAPHIAALAQRLGITDRHLRRIFQAEHGVAPLQYVQTRRLLLAKQLLTDSQLAVGEVALASGFRSLRRFHAAFAGSYRMSPNRLRSRVLAPDTGHQGGADGIRIELAYRAPYAVDALCGFLDRRAIPGVESVDVAARRIRRSLPPGALGEGTPPGWIGATFLPERDRVRLVYASSLAASSARVVAAARRWLDLDAAPHAIDQALATLPGDAGARLPGGLDAFELTVRAVLGQQVTVAGARTLAGRLVERFGGVVETPWSDIDRQFPTPERLAVAPATEIAACGVIGRRAEAIIALATAWPALHPLLANRGAPAALVAALCALPGIGRWTAHYVAMRVLGWPDAFPPGDAAVRAALQRRHGAMTPREVDALAATWQPWRSYAVLRLWATQDGAAIASAVRPPSTESTTP